MPIWCRRWSVGNLGEPNVAQGGQTFAQKTCMILRKVMHEDKPKRNGNIVFK